MLPRVRPSSFAGGTDPQRASLEASRRHADTHDLEVATEIEEGGGGTGRGRGAGSIHVRLVDVSHYSSECGLTIMVGSSLKK